MICTQALARKSDSGESPAECPHCRTLQYCVKQHASMMSARLRAQVELLLHELCDQFLRSILKF